MTPLFSTLPSLLAFQMPGLMEWVIIGGLGLLFFGKRLPEVGKSLGKGIVEFKKGLKGIEEDVESASNAPAAPVATQARIPADQQAAIGAPAAKFDPYTGKPVQPAFDPYTGKPITQQNS